MLKLTFLQSASPALVAFLIFIHFVGFYLLGHRISRNAIKKDPARSKAGLKAINGMLVGLLGLMLAFTFSMSDSRFNTRRALVVEEANTIGTTILRTDMYPDSMRTLLRAHLKDYVEARIAFYEAGTDWEKVAAYYRKGEEASMKAWTAVAAYAKTDDVTTRTAQLIPSLNAMIDIATTRRAAGEGTIPDSILWFLFILCVCSAFLLGYGHPDKVDWIVVAGFAMMLSATIFTIIDLDRPRSGLITMDRSHQRIVDLRQMLAAD